MNDSITKHTDSGKKRWEKEIEDGADWGVVVCDDADGWQADDDDDDQKGERGASQTAAVE